MKRLWIWTGPVSASKSEGALRIIRRLQRQKSEKHPNQKNVVLQVRPTKSKRKEETRSHSRTKNGNEFPCVYVEKAIEMDEVIRTCALDPDIIWLDEIHFWEKDIPDSLNEHFFPYVGIRVQELRERYMFIISGIGASTELTPICPSMGYLMQLADKIYHEDADCDWCGGIGIASRSVYVGQKKKKNTVLVGGQESYKPACPECWTEIKDLSVQEKIRLLEV